MTATEIERIYSFLSTAILPIDTSLERGPGYLSEQLVACRQMQDTLSQHQVAVNRAYAQAKQERRAARAVLGSLRDRQNTPSFITAQDDLLKLEGLFDDLEALRLSVNVARQNLRSTDSDLRLAATLMGQQIQLGVVLPPNGQPVRHKPAPPTPPPPDEEGISLDELLRGEREDHG